MNPTDLLYFIHPKTFQTIEDQLNKLNIIIPENLQGTILKVSVLNAPYYLLVFFLDKEISLNFITDVSADLKLDIELEIQLSSRDLASIFFVKTDDFLLYKLNTVKLFGNKRLFPIFKKYLDDLDLFVNLTPPLQKVSSELQIPINISLGLAHSIIAQKESEERQMQAIKSSIEKIKKEKIHDLASFVNTFQVFSQSIGRLHERLLNLQVKNLITYGKFQNFLKNIKKK